MHLYSDTGHFEVCRRSLWHYAVIKTWKLWSIDYQTQNTYHKQDMPNSYRHKWETVC